jgi:hypothetical protein
MLCNDLGLVPVEPYKVTKLLIEPEMGTDPTLIYGVELEIEGCNYDDYRSHCVPGMEYHEDGSLRNHGAEYVTHPMRMRELVYVLDQFFKKNKFTESNYSERCSVHVHVNVQDMTTDQVKTILMLYQVFERCFFEWVGEERDKNIFCVPWYATNLTYSVLEGNLIQKGKKWQKYTALNLLPIYELGTIEFRHMAGTNDLSKIVQWCNLIGCLTAYARNNKMEETRSIIMDLNTTSAYDSFTHQVFGEYAHVVLYLNNYRTNMEDGVINMKYSITNDNVKVTPESYGVIDDGFFDALTEPAQFNVDQALAEIQREGARPATLANRPPIQWPQHHIQMPPAVNNPPPNMLRPARRR